MQLDPANATELATIARKVGTEVVEGGLRYPAVTGSWQFGDVNLGEYMDPQPGRLLSGLRPVHPRHRLGLPWRGLYTAVAAAGQAAVVGPGG